MDVIVQGAINLADRLLPARVGPTADPWYSTKSPEPPHPEAAEAEARLRMGEHGCWGFSDDASRCAWFEIGGCLFRLAPSPEPLEDLAGRPFSRGDRPMLAMAIRMAALLGYGSHYEEGPIPGRINMIKLIRESFGYNGARR